MRWRRAPLADGLGRCRNGEGLADVRARREMERARSEMVAQQLRARGITDPRVLAAMGKAPRERFIPEEMRRLAYADEALSIGLGQTISQPYMVACMTQAMGLSGKERVLEVGTGSGYQAAVLAELCAEVYTIERVPELSRRASQTLEELGYSNVHFRIGDGTLGWGEEAPFDAIMVTAAAPTIPARLVEQLKDAGRLVIPVGDRYSQVLQVIVKSGETTEETSLCRCVFVPLIGRNGWEEER